MAKGKKTGGRTAGTPNKTTAITRQIINDLAAGLLDTILDDIDQLSPSERVRLFVKLAEFCTPKPQAISLDMTMQTKHTIEDRLAALAQDDQ